MIRPGLLLTDAGNSQEAPCRTFNSIILPHSTRLIGRAAIKWLPSNLMAFKAHSSRVKVKTLMSLD